MLYYFRILGNVTNQKTLVLNKGFGVVNIKPNGTQGFWCVTVNHNSVFKNGTTLLGLKPNVTAYVLGVHKRFNHTVVLHTEIDTYVLTPKRNHQGVVECENTGYLIPLNHK